MKLMVILKIKYKVMLMIVMWMLKDMSSHGMKSLEVGSDLTSFVSFFIYSWYNK